MGKDQTIGILVFAVCIIVIVAYGWLVFLTDWSILVLKLTGFVAIGGILGIGSWIGWTMATTPPPKPLEELGMENSESEEEEESEKPVND
jgi:predicted DNA-binding transcriptional regulator